MKEVLGKTVSSGIAIGRILFFAKEKSVVTHKIITDCQAETDRFNEARECAKKQFDELTRKASAVVGDADARIFEAYEMILDDGMFVGGVADHINSEHVNAEYAVKLTGDELSLRFAQLDDEYFKARATDVKDIADRVISILCSEKCENSNKNFSDNDCICNSKNDGKCIDINEPVIVMAEELTPADTINMNTEKMLSIVTKQGSSLSHTAILARTMNIPALTGVDTDASADGKLAIVDGNNGKLILEPTEETLKEYQLLLEQEAAYRRQMEELKNEEDITSDGKKIMLCANAGGIDDAIKALEYGASGIGLFRSEFIFLDKKDYPTEDEQYEIYKTVVCAMKGKPVVFRTLDIGADKKADYFNIEHEENPALGYRAIRICLDRTDVFKTQLRALYRASAYGKIAVMFPMIISLEEVLKIKAVCEEVKESLKKDAIDYGDVELGIMIETPAAVMISDILAKEVDFFSIGTNDLTQYTLAIDRQNTRLDKHYNPHHEALLRMIKLVIDNGHAGGCRVGICGELGADTTLTERFIQMGIDELSVSPSHLLPVRKAIRESISG